MLFLKYFKMDWVMLWSHQSPYTQITEKQNLWKIKEKAE